MITGATRVLALLGRPVRHSASPAMHNAWLQEAGIDAVYVCLETDTADPAQVVRAGLWGANVTIPLKGRCRPDRLEPHAAATGAVNTLYWDGEVLVGANTDVEGFRTSTEAALGPLTGRRVVVLGGGGAARAVVHACREASASEVTCRARRPVEGLPTLPLDRPLPDVDLVVNTLPAPARAAVQALRPPETAAWVDLNYWDPDPPHRDAVRAAGRAFVEGHAMLEAQAAAAFFRWTGRTPPSSGRGGLRSPGAER